MRRSFGVATVGLVLSALLVLTLGISCALATEEGPTPADASPTSETTPESTQAVTLQIEGTVDSVDTEAALLTLVTAGGDKVVVSANQSTVITVNGSTGTLADIQPGDSVELAVDETTDVATSITVDGGSSETETPPQQAQQGTVENVEVEAGLLVLTTPNGEARVVSVDQSAEITINGSEGILADIQPGDSVEVEVNEGTDVATSVTVERSEEVGAAAQQGTVESVDPETGEMTVALASGDTITVNADQSTAITIDGSTGTLGNIQAGDSVKVEVDETNDVATSITVERRSSDTETSPEQAKQGTVESVDAAAGEMTVALAGSDTVKVKVNQSTTISVNGSAGTLGGIQAGDSVKVEIDGTDDVATSVTVQGDAQVTTKTGEITEVDPASQTVTVETRDNKVLHLRILMLDAGTQIIIDDGEGSLIDLAQGSSVEVAYNPETMVVSTIRVRTSSSSGAGDSSYSP